MARRPLEPSDYLDIFSRRRWYFVVPAIVVSLTVFAVSMRLPRQYKSEAMVVVDPQKVPDSYVKPTISSDTVERLQTISQQILSRTQLMKLIDQFHLYTNERTRVSEDQLVEAMRKDIGIDIIAPNDQRLREQRTIGGFKLSYAAPTPEVAQLVTRQISSLFIEGNLRVREQQAEGTSEFIDTELGKARQELQLQESKVRTFKGRYMGSLPEQQQSNFQMISNFQSLLQSNSDALNRANQQKAYLESMMKATEAATNNGKPMRLESETALEARRSELIAAEQKYTDDHPDVERLRGEVKALEARVSADKKAAGSGVSETESQFRSQLLATQQEIKQRTEKQSEIENRIRQIQSRVEGLPAVEAQFSDLNRDYEISKKHYQELLDKHNSSQIAAEMERRAKGEQFTVIDPPSLPIAPFKPDLIQLNAMGILGGIALGLLLGITMEFSDNTLHCEKDVTFQLSVPVLAVMPFIYTSDELRTLKSRRRRSLAIVSAATLAVVSVIGLLIVYQIRTTGRAF